MGGEIEENGVLPGIWREPSNGSSWRRHRIRRGVERRTMPLLSWLDRGRYRYGIAVAEGFVLAGRTGHRNRRSSAIETNRQEIPPDLIRVSAVEPNIRAVSNFAQLAEKSLDSIRFTGRRIALVLPDMAVRAFAVPSDVKSTRSQVLAHIAPRLSYPSSEARLDTWRCGAGWTLAASVRHVVLRQYEQALEALGCHVSWVDGASLIGIQEWSRTASHSRDGLRILLQLYPRHYALSIMEGGELRDVRMKLRTVGDESRIADQIGRASTHFGGARVSDLTVQGEGALRLVERLEAAGTSRERIRLGQEGEEPLLSHLLRLLLMR